MFTFLVELWKKKHEKNKTKFAFKSDVHSSVTVPHITSVAKEGTE